jgi:hypothetical protein
MHYNNIKLWNYIVTNKYKICLFELFLRLKLQFYQNVKMTFKNIVRDLSVDIYIGEGA